MFRPSFYSQKGKICSSSQITFFVIYIMAISSTINGELVLKALLSF